VCCLFVFGVDRLEVGTGQQRRSGLLRRAWQSVAAARHAKRHHV
jgi:hypothetical protein